MIPERDTQIRLSLCMLQKDPIKKKLDKELSSFKKRNPTDFKGYRTLEIKQERYVIGAYPELFGKKK